MPVLGVPGEGPPAEASATLASLRRQPVPLLVGKSATERVPGALTARLEGTAWRWSGTDRLLVQAFAERPSWTARAQRLQFLAGVLAGLGGGFLIWSLELWYGVATRAGPGGG